MLYRSPSFFRFFFVVAAGFAFPFVVPLFSSAVSIDANLSYMFFIFAVLIGFLMDRALQRRQLILVGISVELSRFRRIHHVAGEIEDVVWKKSS